MATYNSFCLSRHKSDLKSCVIATISLMTNTVYITKVKELCQELLDDKCTIDEYNSQLRELNNCPDCHTTTSDLSDIEVVKQQRTPEWLERRKGMITASEVGTILGANKYQSCTQLLMQKLNITKFAGNKFTKHGQEYEQVALDRYCNERGHKLHYYGLLQSKTVPWLGGSPDAVTACGRLVEVKCPVKRKIIYGEVPHMYYHQIQLLLFVTGLQHADFVELGGSDEFHICPIIKDENWFVHNKAALETFHKRLLECQKFPELAPRPKKRKNKFDFGKNKK